MKLCQSTLFLYIILTSALLARPLPLYIMKAFKWRQNTTWKVQVKIKTIKNKIACDAITSYTQAMKYLGQRKLSSHFCNRKTGKTLPIATVL